MHGANMKIIITLFNYVSYVVLCTVLQLYLQVFKKSMFGSA